MHNQKVYKNSSDLELIKYISIITMVIDHIGMMFYPGADEFRLIGRFAYIGFSFLLAYNYKYNTHNKFTYKLRLLIWAMISQLVYNNIAPGELNILFLLLMGIYSIDSFNEIKQGKVIYPAFLLATSLLVSLVSGYFIFGILVIVFFYYSLESKKIFSLSSLECSLFKLWHNVWTYISFLALHNLQVTCTTKDKKNKRNPILCVLPYPPTNIVAHISRMSL